MVKILRSINGNVVKTFTLDSPQPYKHPMYLDYPVAGTLTVGGGGKDTVKKMVVKSYRELNNLLWPA